MSLSTFVKVGEITNLSDARYCAGMGVDLLGFNVVENTTTYVDPEKFEEIVGWVVGVSYCAELGDHLPDTNLIDSLKNAGITYVESTDQQVLEHTTNFTKIFKIVVSAENIENFPGLLSKADSFADMVLLECEEEAIFSQLDQAVCAVGNATKVLKGYGLNSQSIDDLEKLQLHGIALKGSEEIKPGYKDFDELAEILEALEVD